MQAVQRWYTFARFTLLPGKRVSRYVEIPFSLSSVFRSHAENANAHVAAHTNNPFVGLSRV